MPLRWTTRRRSRVKALTLPEIIGTRAEATTIIRKVAALMLRATVGKSMPASRIKVGTRTTEATIIRRETADIETIGAASKIGSTTTEAKRKVQLVGLWIQPCRD